MLSLEFTGPAGFINRNEVPAYVHLSDFTSNSDSAECSRNVDLAVSPFQCNKIEDTDNCNPYYCRIRQTDDGCRQKEWNAEEEEDDVIIVE